MCDWRTGCRPNVGIVRGQIVAGVHWKEMSHRPLHEHRVAVGQRHHEERHLAQHPVQLHQCVGEIHLRLARRVHQRHKHFLVALREFPHRLLHAGVAAGETLIPGAVPRPDWLYAAACAATFGPPCHIRDPAALFNRRLHLRRASLLRMCFCHSGPSSALPVSTTFSV